MLNRLWAPTPATALESRPLPAVTPEPLATAPRASLPSRFPHAQQRANPASKRPRDNPASPLRKKKHAHFPPLSTTRCRTPTRLPPSRSTRYSALPPPSQSRSSGVQTRAHPQPLRLPSLPPPSQQPAAQHPAASSSQPARLLQPASALYKRPRLQLVAGLRKRAPAHGPLALSSTSYLLSHIPSLPSPLSIPPTGASSPPSPPPPPPTSPSLYPTLLR